MRGSRFGARSWVAAAIAVLLLGAACSRQGNGSPTAGESQGPGELAPPDKQVLRIVNPEPNFLDPQRASFGDDIAIIRQIYRGLLYVDKNDANKVVPAAAKEVPSSANGGISADGKTYT